MSRPRENCGESASEHAAATWFARQRDGLPAHQELEFAKWLDANETNRAAYDAVAQVWEITGGAAGDPRIAQMRSEALMRRRERRSGLWAGLAAAVLLTVTAGGWRFFHSSVASVASIASAAPLSFQTGIGERSTITLTDGSQVTLNTRSTLRVTFTQDRRNVMLLAGQALFHVAKDKSRPFVVTVGDRQVIAVGTMFDVRIEPQGVRVALIDGRVKVQRVLQAPSPGAPSSVADSKGDTGAIAILEPGEELSTAPGGTASVRVADIADLVSWREGRVRFDGTPLREAVVEMNRYSRIPIVIADPRVGEIRVSGAFRTGQSRSFVDSVTDLFPIRADATANAIVLRKAD